MGFRRLCHAAPDAASKNRPRVGRALTWGGFTLAEVLITLGIIGVVAALTIPSLIADYKKQENVTRLKKAYSVLNQAFKRAEVDNGEYVNWEKGAQITDPGLYFRTYWHPYLKNASICESAQTCGYPDNMPWKHPNGGNWSLWAVYTNSTRTLFRFGDGIIVFQPRNTRDAQGNPSYVNLLMVDINGPKAPNIIGKDAFYFVMDNSGIIPPDWGCTVSNGIGCANKIMQDGWQIKDDYPW